MCTSTAVKTGTIKRRRHFNVTVYTLLSQHSYFGSRAHVDKGRTDVFINIKRGDYLQTRIVGVQKVVKLFPRAVFVITQGLNTVSWFRSKGAANQAPAHSLQTRR